MGNSFLPTPILVFEILENTIILTPLSLAIPVSEIYPSLTPIPSQLSELCPYLIGALIPALAILQTLRRQL